MTARANPEPKVGIFWLFGTKLILDTTPLSHAELYGEAKTHPRGHLQHWAELQRRGVMSPDIECGEPPRGRVEFYPRDKQCVLYADRCILARKNFVR